MQNLFICKGCKVIFSKASAFVEDEAGAVAMYSALALLLLLGILSLAVNMSVSYSDQEKALQLVRSSLTQPAKEYPYLWLRRIVRYHMGVEKRFDTSGYLFCSKCPANTSVIEMTDVESNAATIRHIKNYIKSNGVGIIEKVNEESIKPVFKRAPDGTIILYVSVQIEMVDNFRFAGGARNFTVESGKVVIPGDYVITASQPNPDVPIQNPTQDMINELADKAYHLLDSSGKLAREVCDSSGGDQCQKLECVVPHAVAGGKLSWQKCGL